MSDDDDRVVFRGLGGIGALSERAADKGSIQISNLTQALALPQHLLERGFVRFDIAVADHKRRQKLDHGQFVPCNLHQEADRADQTGFDLDVATEPDLDVPPRPAALYGLNDLNSILRCPELLPPGTEVVPADAHSFALIEPGLHDRVPVTAVSRSSTSGSSAC